MSGSLKTLLLTARFPPTPNLVPRARVDEAEGEILAFGFVHKRSGNEITQPHSHPLEFLFEVPKYQTSRANSEFRGVAVVVLGVLVS